MKQRGYERYIGGDGYGPLPDERLPPPTWDEGIRAAQRAVLKDAIEVIANVNRYIKDIDPDEPKEPDDIARINIRKRTLWWVYHSDERYVFGFEWCCRAANLDPCAVREEITKRTFARRFASKRRNRARN